MLRSLPCHTAYCNFAHCYNACRYPDYVLTDSGLQYKDLRDGSGDTASKGSRVTVDWDGYTLGYYGRPFEARNKVPGDKTFCIEAAQLSSVSGACFAGLVYASIQLVAPAGGAVLVLLSPDSCLWFRAVQGRSLRRRHQGLPQVHCGRSRGEQLQANLAGSV